MLTNPGVTLQSHAARSAVRAAALSLLPSAARAEGPDPVWSLGPGLGYAGAPGAGFLGSNSDVSAQLGFDPAIELRLAF